jgi:hypothetical protein
MLAYRYLGWTLVLYGLGYLLAPIEPNFDISSNSLWLWLASAAASMAGLMVAPWLWRQWAPPASPSDFVLKQASQRVNLLAAVGLVCTLIDRYLLRGVPLDFDFFAARDALEATTPTPIGVIGALLGALACFALGLTVARGVNREHLSPLDWGQSLLIFGVYIGISMGVGSRSVLLVSIICTMFTVIWLRKAHGQPLHLRYWLLALGTLLVVAVISAALMLERLDLMGLDPMLSIEYSGYAYTVRPDSGAMRWLMEHSDSAPLLVAGFSLLQYVYHGLFEFSLFVQEPFVQHTGGSVTFWLPLKFLNLLQLNLGTVDFDAVAGWREGIFTTFLGPLYLDFGWQLPVAAFVLFVALGLPAASLSANRLAALPYCSVLCALCVLFPVVNLLDSAAGAYPLAASVLVPWLGRQRRRACPP